MVDIFALGITSLIGVPVIYNIFKDPHKRAKKELESYWESQCKNLKLYDNQGVIPYLNKLEKTKYGFKAVTQCPLGKNLEDIKKHKATLESNLPGLIEIKKDKYSKHVYLKFIIEQPKFEFKPVKINGNELFIAFKHNGKAFKINLNLDPHILIGGTTGTGKTFLMANVLANLIYNNSSKIELYLSQIMKGEIGVFKNCKCVKDVSYDLENTCRILKKLAKEVDTRSKIFTDKGIKNIGQWNEKYGKKKYYKRLFIFIEEVSFFIADDKLENKETIALKKECWNYILTIAKAGRSSGVHFLSCTQRSTCANIPPEVKAQMSRVSLRQRQNNDSMNIIGTTEATNLAERECIFDGSTYEYLVSPGIDEDFKGLQQYVKEIIVPDDVVEQERINNDMVITKRVVEEKHEKLTPTRAEFESMLAAAKVKNIIKDNKVIKLNVKKEEATFDLSPREKEIYNFIDKYGAITIKQATRLFFRDSSSYKSAYSSCSRTLIKMQKTQALKPEVNKITGEKMYFIKRAKTVHDLNIINVYIELLEVGAVIEEFKTEHHLLDGKLRPDGFVQFKLNNKLYKAFIECDMSHFTTNKKIKLYERLERDFIILLGKEEKPVCNSEKILILHLAEDFSDLKDKLFSGQDISCRAQ